MAKGAMVLPAARPEEHVRETHTECLADPAAPRLCRPRGRIRPLSNGKRGGACSLASPARQFRWDWWGNPGIADSCQRSARGTPCATAIHRVPAKAVSDNATFPIVGIGASAGGVEALEGFFRGLPSKPDVGVVVVTHLSPTRESNLSEILARFTTLPVHLVQHGTEVRPNAVYVLAADSILGSRTAGFSCAGNRQVDGNASPSTSSLALLPGIERNWRSVSYCPGATATARSVSRPSRSAAV